MPSRGETGSLRVPRASPAAHHRSESHQRCICLRRAFPESLTPRLLFSNGCPEPSTARLLFSELLPASSLWLGQQLACELHREPLE